MQTSTQYPFMRSPLANEMKFRLMTGFLCATGSEFKDGWHHKFSEGSSSSKSKPPLYEHETVEGSFPLQDFTSSTASDELWIVGCMWLLFMFPATKSLSWWLSSSISSNSFAKAWGRMYDSLGDFSTSLELDASATAAADTVLIAEVHLDDTEGWPFW